MLKNRQLTRNINSITKQIFLKFCYFSLLMLLLGCKDQIVSKKEVLDVKEDQITTKNNANNSTKKIVFFGDSLTAGYGLEDVDDAYPSIIQTKIDSLQLKYTVINSGISGETTAGGKNRINWVLNQKPDVFVLELGANDGLRGLPLQETRNNLQFMIDVLQKKYPDCKIVLAGMQIPPNMGQDYTTGFKNIFPELAQKNNISLIPFLLENVGGVPELNQADGIHPTKKGHQILAKNVWDVLKNIL